MGYIKTIIITFLFLVPLSSYSAILYGIVDGDWDSGTSWSYTKGDAACGCTPAAGDHIYIPANFTITITDQEDLSGTATYIEIAGELHFQSGKKLTLECGSSLNVLAGASITAGGGGGNSNYIKICGATEWRAADGTFSGPGALPVGALPINLVEFFVELEQKGADIYWTTSNELNNDFFTIERSQDGFNFENVDIVNGAGNSNKLIEYASADSYPIKGISYYRLKQTDYNGDYTYSKIVSINNQISKPFSFDIYPNPVSRNENLYVAIDGVNQDQEILVVVYDVLGNMLYSKIILENINNGTVIAIDPHKQLPPGTYIIIGASNEKVYKKKLIIRE